MPALVDESLDIWLGGVNEHTPRLLHYYGGAYWLFCLDLFSHHVEVWKIDPDAGPSFVAQGERVRTNTTKQQGWEQLSSDSHWDLTNNPIARIVFLDYSIGGVALTGWNFDREVFEFASVGPSAAFSVISASLFSYDDYEELKPVLVAVTPEDINVPAAAIIYGDDRERIGAVDYDRARTIRFSDALGGYYTYQDITGITATGSQIHSRPRAIARNEASQFYAHQFAVQDSSAGVALWHTWQWGGGVQGTASRVSPYFAAGSGFIVGLPWYSEVGRTAITFGSSPTDAYYITYGPSSALGSWSPTTPVALPAPPIVDATDPGGSLYSLVGVVWNGFDTIYAVGLNDDLEYRRIWRTQSDGEGSFSDWAIAVDAIGDGPITVLTATTDALPISTREGEAVCLVWEQNPEGSAELGRQVYYHFDGESAGGSLSGPGGGVGGNGNGGSAFYVS